MLVISTLALLAAQPLMRPLVPCSHDGSLCLLRVVEGDHLIRHGHLYPRWAPDMAYGYGYPLFNFYPPLSWYVVETFHLVGLPLVLAWNAALALCLLASGAFAYLLARDRMPEHGALVTATAYMLAPCTLYNVYFRGNLAESVALPLLPLVLWAFGRLVQSAQARYLALAAISLSLLVLAHQVVAVLFGPVLLAYVLILWGRRRGTSWHLLTVITAGLLALGLSAFFWMPAFLEQDTVQIEQSFTPGSMDFRQNFLTLNELFSPPVPAPASLINPSPPRSLSLAALAMGLLGLLPLSLQLGNRFWRCFKAAFPIFAHDVSIEVRRAWHTFAIGPKPPASGRLERRKDGTNLPAFCPWAKRPRAFQPFVLGPKDQGPSNLSLSPLTSSRERGQLLLLAGVLGLSFMMLSLSLPLWEHIPLFHFVRFPWRFLGPASLLTALLAGNSLSLLLTEGRQQWLIRSAERSWRSLGATAAAVTLLLASSLGWLYPQYCGQPMTGVASIPRFERRTGIIGTTSAREYLPRYVQEIPDPDALVAMYEANVSIARLDPASLPEGASVESAAYGLTSARLLVRSREPFRAVYRAFYFPGWRVAINGENVPIIVTAPHGLISFDVPAGRAAVQVWFGTTPLRLGSTLLSGATLLMVLWLAWQGRREVGFAPASAMVAARWWQWLILVALAGGLLWVKITVVDTGGTWFRPTRLDEQKMDVHLNVDLSDELTLLGYNLPRQRASAGQSLSLELFWAAKGQPTADYGFSVQLVDERGIEWSPKGTRRPGGFHEFLKTQTWQPGEYVRDAHLIDVLPGTPPGRYTLRVTVFERETLAGPDVLNDQRVPAGQSVAVATVVVTRPDRPPAPDELDVTYRLDAPLGSDLTLLGLSLGRLWTAPGDPVPLTTFWRAERQPRGIYTVYANLVDNLGQTAATLGFLPGAPQHATHQWQAGEVIRDQQVWAIPAYTPPGRYTIRLRAIDREGQSHGPVWSHELKLEIAAP